MLWCLTLLTLFAAAHGRAVNISNTWMLPEEGFPVFYRHFRDRISWYEADAVCQFHHANLVTVDTTAQYDAVRAYLKELDISNAVWVGLIRSNPDGEFTWTDYRGLSSDGYWSSAPDSGSAPLCAAANPAADYRWEARACGGPMVASFICELPVPSWATGTEGCMVKSIPALTALYLPESAAVQLTADCGLAGVKRVQCTGNIKRDELLKQLSCYAEDNETMSTIPNDFINNPVTTIANAGVQEQYTISETIIPSSSKIVIEQNLETGEKIVKINEDLKPDMTIEAKIIEHDLNLESNEIPKVFPDNNFSNENQYSKLDDDVHIKQKEIHEELARVGNPEGFEKIFSQSSDHFVPPLVIAKAKMSDDMTEISLAEKHAQQLAEMLKNKNVGDDRDETTSIETVTTRDVITTTKSNIKPTKDTEKYGKYSVPKKYSEKYVSKNKATKINSKKRIEKVTDYLTTPKQNQESSFTDMNLKTNNGIDNTATSKFSPIELTITLNEHKDAESNKTPKQYITEIPTTTMIHTTSAKINEDATIESSPVTEITPENNTGLIHEIVKITIPNTDNTSAAPITFEITTLTSATANQKSKESTEDILTSPTTTAANSDTYSTTPETIKASSTFRPKLSTNIDIDQEVPSSAPVNVRPVLVKNIEVESKIEVKSASTNNNNTTKNMEVEFDITANSTGDDIGTNTTGNDVAASTTAIDIAASTREIEEDTTDDYHFDVSNSPLLSAANEPLRRPNRRRPPQPSKLRFNPFRMLG